MDTQIERLGARIEAQEAQLVALCAQVARLEGLLEGLREALTGKRTA